MEALEVLDRMAETDNSVEIMDQEEITDQISESVVTEMLGQTDLMAGSAAMVVLDLMDQTEDLVDPEAMVVLDQTVQMDRMEVLEDQVVTLEAMDQIATVFNAIQLIMLVVICLLFPVELVSTIQFTQTFQKHPLTVLNKNGPDTMQMKKPNVKSFTFAL